MKADTQHNGRRSQDDAEQILEQLRKERGGMTFRQIAEHLFVDVDALRIEDALRLLEADRLIVLETEETEEGEIERWVAEPTAEEREERQRQKIENVTTAELYEPLTNRGFLLGCALIAEAIDCATNKDISDIEGMTSAFQRVAKVFRELR